MRQQLISIVIPLFNREQLIQETIESVLAQTSPAWELHIVDDGSTDRSFEVVKRYADNDSRIHAWKRESDVKGAPTCRNEGFQKSSQDYVMFLDSDDLLAPNCVEQRLQGVAARPDADFLVYAIEMFDESPGDSEDRWCFLSEDYLSDFLDRPLWQTAAPVWKKSFLLEHRLSWKPELKAWQDWDFHVRALATNPVFEIFSESVHCYCRRSISGRISNSSSSMPSMLQQRTSLFKETIDWLGQAKLLTDSRRHSMARQFIRVAIQFQRMDERKKSLEVLDQAIELGLISDEHFERTSRYVWFESTRRPNLTLINRFFGRMYRQWFYITIPNYAIRRRTGKLFSAQERQNADRKLVLN